MCYYVHKNHLQAKLAKKPLRCFKVLMVPNPYHCPHPLLIEQAIADKAFFDVARSFKFVSGCTYTDDMWGYEGLEFLLASQRLYGFHSYASLASVINNRNNDVYDEVIVEFVIPEGTQYYYNPETDTYFSSTLRCIGHYPLWKAMVGVLLQPIKSISAVF